MSQINIQNLTFCYDGSYDNIFENVSFQIDTDWKLGFTGRNGRGKTTFLHLLLGKYEYTGIISANVTFDYFPFQVPDKDLDTLEVLTQLLPDAPQWEIMRELSLLEVPEDAWYRAFGTLSQGEQTKALLASLFLHENRFLLIDEPTNHLDAEARQTVGKYLRSKKGFILVSHDRAFLDACADHILSINKADIQVQKGNFSTWWQNKELQDEFEMAENDKLKKDIVRLEKASRRTAKWSDQIEATKNGTLIAGLKADKGRIGHMSAKMMKRSKAIESRQQTAMEEKSRLLKNIETADNLKIFPLRHHADTLVSLENVSIHYAEKTACEKISFAIKQGERVALQGKNGSGKSSILKLILQEAGKSGNRSGVTLSYKNASDIIAPCESAADAPFTFHGHLDKASGLVISYVSQDTSHLRGTLTDYAKSCSIDETVFKTNLAKLDFSRLQFEKNMESYSEGQKKKVLLARSLSEKTHLYIWDEPLNYIDVLSRMQIEKLIQAYGSTMLFVEHDKAFTDAVATRVISL